MSNDQTIEILNELLERETRSLLPRLRESTVFISWASADEQRIIDGMIDEETEHRHWLVEAIIRMGSDPRPVSADVECATLHYLELDSVLPRVVADHQRLVAAYETAADRTTSNPVAADLIPRILERHRKHADRIEALAARAKSLSR